MHPAFIVECCENGFITPQVIQYSEPSHTGRSLLAIACDEQKGLVYGFTLLTGGPNAFNAPSGYSPLLKCPSSSSSFASSLLCTSNVAFADMKSVYPAGQGASSGITRVAFLWVNENDFLVLVYPFKGRCHGGPRLRLLLLRMSTCRWSRHPSFLSP